MAGPGRSSPRPARAWRPRERRIRNPVQDLTPASLVTAIVTEHGALRPPFASSIAAVLPVSEAVEMPEAAGASSTPVPPVDSASSAAEAVG